MKFDVRARLLSLGCLTLALATSGAVAEPAAAVPRSASPASATAAAKGYQLRVFAQNIEGAVDPGGTRLKKVRSVVGRFNPQVIMLEEICKSDLPAFKKNFPGFASNFHYTKMLNKSGCKHNKSGSKSASIGELVASKYSLTNVGVYDLPFPTTDKTDRRNRKFHLTCADVSLPAHLAKPVRACVTHLRSGHKHKSYSVKQRNKTRRMQDAKIASVTHAWLKSKTVVLAGDFNATPGDATLNSIYALSNSGSFTGAGHFVESDQTDASWFPGACHSSSHCRSGQPTIDTASNAPSPPKRYDYIFFSKGPNYDLHGVALKGDQSDHLPIRSTATLPT